MDKPNKSEIRITEDMISKLLKGHKIEWIEPWGYKIILLPPQDGVFITHDELRKIVMDRTNGVERLLRLMEEE